ncbi:hypothetical protein PUN28_015959 [Cardiocondyla obscurior]|uniref:Uncharacterized protein n=1 Tax=Cardiocondyla obscurior TaxID=286306 RepID=A0AAW2ESQ3_9HYME
MGNQRRATPFRSTAGLSPQRANVLFVGGPRRMGQTVSEALRWLPICRRPVHLPANCHHLLRLFNLRFSLSLFLFISFSLSLLQDVFVYFSLTCRSY